jgi:hypothetical protein
MSRRDGMLRDVEMGYDVMILKCTFISFAWEWSFVYLLIY